MVIPHKITKNWETSAHSQPQLSQIKEKVWRRHAASERKLQTPSRVAHPKKHHRKGRGA